MKARIFLMPQSLDGFGLFAWAEGNGMRYSCPPIDVMTLFEKEPDARNFERRPTMMLEADQAQQLANDLWDAGIRPAQSKMSHGAFEAQGQHLNDMRAIAFGNLALKGKAP